MSPRRARRRDDKGPPIGPPGRFGIGEVEEWPDGEWRVHRIVGGAADKVYRCPGCDQEIRTGTAHLVSWPNWSGGEGERRHWHTACWRNRLSRGPGRSRY
ncbi:ATP/GTP-binding protein [Acrocarpospora catenulata]|uniref:ATP/GTP-binding protein n=1 Tax=Acrocarpospora catenulata TaxID=2836182 RepID=UPI001BD979B9|nr:ATP/GTP-binding protein [Acrocarpospora catenulata]